MVIQVATTDSPGGSESGALMMFVLMAVLLVGAITVSAIQIIGTDVLGSIKEIEADQVYNIAQAGVHYAIGQLQGGTANTYAGETKTITSGTTTLGTATITVNCIDTGASPNPSGCGTTDQYRRIISTPRQAPAGAGAGADTTASRPCCPGKTSRLTQGCQRSRCR